MDVDELDLGASATDADASAANSVPDAAVVSIADALSHALDSGVGDQQQHQQTEQPESSFLGPPPPPLPIGWVMRESRAQPGYHYYFNYETGETSWFSPIIPDQVPAEGQESQEAEGADVMDHAGIAAAAKAALEKTSTAKSQPSDTKKRPHEEGAAATASASSSSKRAKASSSSASSSGNKKPSKVRILHILKKHKGSRRPSSWRQAKITSTKEESTEELQGLIDILKEESGEAQRATFEELARTESDCSSAKRGGDLGFFGPKKMQPAFEEASFKLKIGELSGIVETSSGVHVLLRIG